MDLVRKRATHITQEILVASQDLRDKTLSWKFPHFAHLQL
jgi:hypothetical protein